MYRVCMPVTNPVETEAQHEWRENAPWRLVGLCFMLSSVIVTTLLYVHLARAVIAAFSS